MFGQKFRKQFAQMFPLPQLQSQEQSANRSLNKNSNEDQSEDGDGRVTPHYKGIEDDEEKPVQKFDNWQESSHIFEEQLQKTNSQGEKNYQRMRENPNINYEQFLHRKITFKSEDGSQLDQTKQIVIVVPAGSGTKQQEYDFSPVNSSFQRLMDSNFKRMESTEEKKPQTISKPPIYIEEQRSYIESQVYPEVMIDEEPLTNDMLLDPEIRWELILELLSLENTQQHSIRQSPQFDNVLDGMQQRHQRQKEEFNKVAKTAEQKFNKAQQLLEQSLDIQIEERQKKQFLAVYKYQKAKDWVFEKFSQKATKDIQCLHESIGKRFQHVNLQMMRAKRVLTHSLQSSVKQLLQQEQQIQQEMNQLKICHNQSLQNITKTIEEKFSRVEEEIREVRRQVTKKKSIVQEGLERLEGKVMALVEKEILEGQEMEEQLMQVLLALVKKLE